MNDTAMEMEVIKSYMNHKQVCFCGILIAFTCLNSRDAAEKVDARRHSQKGCEMPLTLEVMCQPLIHECWWELIPSFSEYTDLQVRKKKKLAFFWSVTMSFLSDLKVQDFISTLKFEAYPQVPQSWEVAGHISVVGVMDCVSQVIDSWVFHRMKWFKLV